MTSTSQMAPPESLHRPSYTVRLASHIRAAHKGEMRPDCRACCELLAGANQEKAAR